MRNITKGLAALAVGSVAVVAPLLTGGMANASVPSGIDTTTYADGTTYHHEFNLDYTCIAGADGKTIITGNDVGSPTGSGTLGSVTLTPNSSGGGTFAFSGVNGSYHYSYGGTYDVNGTWVAPTTATADDGSYSLGTAGTTGTDRGSVVGSFSGLPNCPTPEVPPTATGNHGQFVSGATHYGYKGKDLAVIAKDNSLVGPFDNNKVPASVRK